LLRYRGIINTTTPINRKVFIEFISQLLKHTFSSSSSLSFFLSPSDFDLYLFNSELGRIQPCKPVRFSSSDGNIKKIRNDKALFYSIGPDEWFDGKYHSVNRVLKVLNGSHFVIQLTPMFYLKKKKRDEGRGKEEEEEEERKEKERKEDKKADGKVKHFLYDHSESDEDDDDDEEEEEERIEEPWMLGTIQNRFDVMVKIVFKPFNEKDVYY
jgi:hypothetical protein